MSTKCVISAKLNQIGQIFSLMVLCFVAHAGCNLSVPSTQPDNRYEMVVGTLGVLLGQW